MLLDERSDFLNYLQELRRVNAGDDRSDMPGYSLYVVRMPVSILPGADTIKGRGAMVTVQAKHDLTGDVLANTFRNVVILDTAYQLMDVVTRGQYLLLNDVNYDECAGKLGEPVTFKCMPGGSVAADHCAVTAKPTEPVTTPPAEGNRKKEQTIPRAVPEGISSGLNHGGQGSSAGSEVIAIYGANNLRRLVCAVKQDNESWYRHDPSVVSWLLAELSSAHTYMREQRGSAILLSSPRFSRISGITC